MTEPTSSSFHPFPRLPLEIRQQIWELSIAPREVVIVSNDKFVRHGRQASPPPPLLVASGESRSYCQRFYTKTYHLDDSGNPREPVKYTWINFAFDEVYMLDLDFVNFSAIALVRWLTLVSPDGDYFFYHVQSLLRDAKALEALTIIDAEGGPDISWYIGWSDFMEMRYLRCNPVPYYTKIVYGDVVLTPENMVQFERAWYKTQWEPELEEEYGSHLAMSDDDADPRDSRRRRWQHSKECTCPQKSRPRNM
ncbi:hypothetical protein C8A05DRAFT_19732 [Staphylotrichum tortipilum]|uniref:2EXR domain-containing protein n=1 Tax=Staphylotrichum tortipilum TaxID=2831512 RepID=A0AAN6MAV4_9PEZI|nr:hypothetical protein C8A05DRAFT_19732 [Staphylotrichum longicolle]